MPASKKFQSIPFLLCIFHRVVFINLFCFSLQRTSEQQHNKYKSAYENPTINFLSHPRDLGEQIRKQVTKLTDASSHNTETTAQLTKQIDALERISNNIYAKKYPRRYESTATGLTAAQCSQVLSSEFLQYLNDGAAKRD